jgi:protoporphyrinogen oxidase
MSPPPAPAPGGAGASGGASADLVILGAGPAGLAAAWRAARRGLSVVVLEKSTQVGGLAGSFEVDGITVDYGSHRLNPATHPEILADLRGLLGDDLQTRTRRDRLRIADRVGRVSRHSCESSQASSETSVGTRTPISAATDRPATAMMSLS